VFAPFHYGTWDLDDLSPDDDHRQANELTMTVWDPVSKQPYFKTAACRVRKVRDGDGSASAPTTTGSAPGPGLEHAVQRTAGGLPTTSVVVETPHYANDPAEHTAGGTPTRTFTGRS
jgi:hypothetical protein